VIEISISALTNEMTSTKAMKTKDLEFMRSFSFVNIFSNMMISDTKALFIVRKVGIGRQEKFVCEEIFLFSNA